MAKTNNQKPSSPKTKVTKNIPSHRSSKKGTLNESTNTGTGQRTQKKKKKAGALSPGSLID